MCGTWIIAFLRDLKNHFYDNKEGLCMKVLVRKPVAMGLLLEIINIGKCILYRLKWCTKVIIDILRANNEPIEALFDDNGKIHTFLTIPYYVRRKSWVRLE